jgi:hypothetical protein
MTYIGEHIVSDIALFDAYLAKVVPMIERFGGGLTRNPGGRLEAQSGGHHRIPRYGVDQKLVPGTGISATHCVAPKCCY